MPFEGYIEKDSLPGEVFYLQTNQCVLVAFSGGIFVKESTLKIQCYRREDMDQNVSSFFYYINLH